MTEQLSLHFSSLHRDKKYKAENGDKFTYRIAEPI